MKHHLLACALVAVSAACGDDPVSFSEPVGIRMTADSGDLVDGRIEEDKNINTESGNPYGAFIDSARAEVGGDPSAIEVDEVTITLDAAGSTNVAALGLVFADVAVSFEMSSGELVPVADQVLTADTDAGPVALDVAFDSGALSDEDYADLLGGGFKVWLSGEAAAGFEALDANADVEVTFLLTALD
jgi:hypothetical protein